VKKVCALMHKNRRKILFRINGKEKNLTGGGIWKSDYHDWLNHKYFPNENFKAEDIFISDCKVLEAGCGAGMSAIALLGDKLHNLDYLGVDISDSVDIARKKFEEYGYSKRSRFIQCNLNHIPVQEGKFDVIFSEGVLHHTDSTEQAIYDLAPFLKQNGYFMFYVYAKKSPIREFSDDYIRGCFSSKSNDETWEGLEALTKLGKALGDLNIEIDVPENIPYLGIQKGKINLQRLFYWNIFKCYYRPDWSIEEMNHVNFDWYRPANCHRQTPEEVRKWCENAGLDVSYMNVEEAGITVVSRKK